MPKLPDYRDVGKAPIGMSGRQRVSARDLDASAIGRGLQAVGAVGAEISEDLKKKEDTSDLAKADAILKEETARFERAFDNDTEYGTYGKKYETGATAIRNQAASVIRSPSLRQRFLDKNAGWHGVRRESMIGVGVKRQDEKYVKDIETTVDRTLELYGKPDATEEQRGQAKADIEAYIELARRNGTLTPQRAEEIRKKVLPSIAMADIRRRMMQGQTPELYKDWQDYIKLKPGNEPSLRPGAVKIDGKGIVQFGDLPITVKIDPSAPYMKRKRKIEDLKGGEIILHGTRSQDGQGRPLGADFFVRYGQRVDRERGFDAGYHFYIDKDGTIIQGAPLDRITNGAKNRNKRQIHIALIGADGTVRVDGPNNDPTPEQAAAAKALASGLGPQLGINPKNIHGHGEIQTDRNSREAGLIAKELREKGYIQPKDPGVAVDGEGEPVNMDEARREQLKAIFGPLDQRDLIRLGETLRRQSKVSLEGKRRELKNALEDEVSSVRKHGVGRADYGDSIKTASKVLTRNQIDTHRMELAKARAYWTQTKDVTELSPGQMQERLESLAPQPGEKDHALKSAILRDVKKAYDDQIELRRKDPALAVDKSPIVEAYRQGVGLAANLPGLMTSDITTTGDGGDQQVEAPVVDVSGLEPKTAVGYIQARLEAQDEVGIPPSEQRTITRDQAATLIPSVKGLDYTQALAVLKQSAAKIEAQFGPYAKQVMTDALVLSRTPMGENSAAAGVLAKLARGEAPSQRDISMMDAYRQIELENGFMMPMPTSGSSVIPAAYNQSLPALWQGTRTPTQAQLEYVNEDPANRSALFDEMFGPGAYNAAVEYQRQK